MTECPDNDLIKAVTGLEGGCVACGSTCGVVSAGALCLALAHEAEIEAGGCEAKKEVLARVNEFAGWFAANYGTFLCRERTRADFYSKWGQLKYFLTFYRMAGCFRHMRGTLRHLYLYQFRQQQPLLPEPTRSGENCTLHCAGYVMENIRKNTGIGNQRLEALSFVFDGGVGLSGGLCGALAGAVTGINILMGLPVRQQSYWKTAAGFGIGHVNLLVDQPFGSGEPFAAGKQMVKKFKENAGSFECCEITGKRFSGWDDFQEFIKGTPPCRQLMALAIDEASRIIKSYQ